MNFTIRYIQKEDFSDFKKIMTNEQLAKLANMRQFNNDLELDLFFKSVVNRSYNYAILNSDHHLIGMIFLFEERKELFELGYLLMENYWNQHIMSKSLAVVLNQFKKQMNHGEVLATVNVNNTASKKVLENNGFEVKVKSQVSQSNFDQSLQTEIVYSKVF